MANRRVLVKRRKAARNIRKITRTMQLIATARFQAAYNRAVAGKPYTEKLAQLVSGLARAADGIDHPLMQTHEGVDAEAMLVLTSDRGLCGGYNANVLRVAMEHLDARAEAGASTAVTMVGNKGIANFKFRGRKVAKTVRFDRRRIRFKRNLRIGRQTPAPGDAVENGRNRFGRHQGRGAAAEKDAGNVPRTQTVRFVVELRGKGAPPGRLIYACSHMTVEVAVWAFVAAERPMHINGDVSPIISGSRHRSVSGRRRRGG